LLTARQKFRKRSICEMLQFRHHAKFHSLATPGLKAFSVGRKGEEKCGRLRSFSPR
jgi:hypothetical protein